MGVGMGLGWVLVRARARLRVGVGVGVGVRAGESSCGRRASWIWEKRLVEGSPVVTFFICLMLSSSCTPITSLSLASINRLNRAMCPRCSMSKQPTVRTTFPSRGAARLPKTPAPEIFAPSSGHEAHPAIRVCDAVRGGEVLPVPFWSSKSDSCSCPVEGRRGAQLCL